MVLIGFKGFSCRVIEWLKRRAYGQYGVSSKPTRAILLCPWERHVTAHSPAWCSWQAVLNYIHISIKFKRTAISWYLRKQVGVIAYPMNYRLRRFPASQENNYRKK